MANVFYRAPKDFESFTEKKGGILRYDIKDKDSSVIKIDFYGQGKSQFVIFLMRKEIENLSQFFKEILKERK